MLERVLFFRKKHFCNREMYSGSRKMFVTLKSTFACSEVINSAKVIFQTKQVRITADGGLFSLPTPYAIRPDVSNFEESFY